MNRRAGKAMDLFEQAVADALDVETVDGDTVFREVPGWCSLFGFGLLVLMENDWGTPLGIDRFRELTTVRDLEREALVSLAADVLRVPRSSLSGAAAYGSPAAWDSVNHLRLVMESEARFGWHFPVERIAALKTLEAFLADGR